MEFYLLKLEYVKTQVFSEFENMQIVIDENYIDFLIKLFLLHYDVKSTKELYDVRIDDIFQKCLEYMKGLIDLR